MFKIHLKRELFQDGLFLSLVVLLSVVLYVKFIGFYSVDWAHLSDASPARSFSGVFWALYTPDRWMRPVFVFYMAVLYWLFGLSPFGYHLVNTVVLIVGAISFYMVLIEIGQSRLIALAVPAVYILLPHYSTDRFWYASFQITLSMCTYFFSLYADLRSLRCKANHYWAWKSIAIVNLLISTLSYEIFLPLFLLNPLFAWYRKRQLKGQDALFSKSNLLMVVPNLLALAAVSIFKAMVTTRIQPATFAEHISWFVSFFKDAIITLIRGDYGVRFPIIIWRIVRDYPNLMVLMLGVVVGLIVFGYLNRVASQSKGEWLNRVEMFKLVILGFVVFGFGYSIFLTNFNASISTTGLANHTAMAAAVGVGLLIVGGIGWISTWLPAGGWRKNFFFTFVALFCAGGFIVINTLASFWIWASHQQQIILADIHQHIPSLPSGTTLILDEICPYIGPAPIFESTYDFSGALRLLYHDQTLKGDIVTPKMEVRDNGLYTTMYGEYMDPDLYGKLIIYNYRQKATYPISDAGAALSYFNSFNPDHSSGCRFSQEGIGEYVFVKGDPKIEKPY